mmetsp:Transcript_114944/g.330094  ORF Transcript_114944/g.330094 Transcript_114944/m.330094 type:complete len:121 (+) Transcript_114944:116-478(+)
MGCGAVKQERAHMSPEDIDEQEIASSTTADTRRQISGEAAPEPSSDGQNGQETEESAARAFEQQATRPSKILTAVVDELEHRDEHGRKISKTSLSGSLGLGSFNRASSRSGSIRISTKSA